MTIKLSNYFYFQVPLIHVRVGRLQIANVETIDIQIGIFCQFEGFKADFQSILRTLESLFTTFVLFHVRRHKM